MIIRAITCICDNCKRIDALVEPGDAWDDPCTALPRDWDTVWDTDGNHRRDLCPGCLLLEPTDGQ
jgi:hypothetical protein